MFCFSHNFMSYLQTGVKMAKNTNDYSTILEQNDLTEVAIETVDGEIKCSFTRPKITKVEGVVYDLATKYFLSIAQGSIQGTYSIVRKMILICLLYTSPSPRDLSTSRMPSSA